MPIADAGLWVPALGPAADPRSSILVDFLADTGADVTVLNPQDSGRLFGHDAQLWDVIRAGVVATVNGAGQGQPHYLVRGSVFFQHEDGELDYRSTVLYVAEPFEGNAEMESVLGRDVLGHYKAVFDRNRDLTLE